MAIATSIPRFDGPTAELDDDALIKARLYSTEERLFKRIQKRCTTVIDLPADIEDLSKLQEDIELDFAVFEAAIMRVQLLTDANRKEVARYEEKKEGIVKASQKAKADMSSLHSSLQSAHETKEHKLIYDEIAREILKAPNLKPRQTQHEAIAKLEAEIKALEGEKDDYGKVWAARRMQFGEIVNALTGMQTQIQEEKEEQERREALEEEDEEGGQSQNLSQGGDGTTGGTPGEGKEGEGMEVDSSGVQVDGEESMAVERTPTATPTADTDDVDVDVDVDEGERVAPAADAMDTT